MTNFEGLLATLVRHEVAFILVGGAAAIAHHISQFRAIRGRELRSLSWMRRRLIHLTRRLCPDEHRRKELSPCATTC
jgi:hypothetical protein